MDGSLMAGHVWCPVCGLFGIRKRRRDRKFADAALIAFYARLAAEVRAERRQPRVTLYDIQFRRVAGPMTARQLADAGIEVSA